MKTFIKTFFQKELRAFYTPEAAIIVPLLILILFQIVLLSFTIHDTVSAKNSSYRYLIDYSMNSPNNLNLQTIYDTEKILENEASFSTTLMENNLRISSKLYTLPVTFSNYNNTELLRKYLILKKIKKENL